MNININLPSMMRWKNLLASPLVGKPFVFHLCFPRSLTRVTPLRILHRCTGIFLLAWAMILAAVILPNGVHAQQEGKDPPSPIYLPMIHTPQSMDLFR